VYILSLYSSAEPNLFLYSVCIRFWGFSRWRTYQSWRTSLFCVRGGKNRTYNYTVFSPPSTVAISV